MTTLTTALITAACASYALKLAGVCLPDAALNHPHVRRTAELLPVSMLAALVAVDALTDGHRYAVDVAVLLGTVAAIAALALRQGVLVVFVAATAVAAVVRLIM